MHGRLSRREAIAAGLTAGVASLAGCGDDGPDHLGEEPESSGDGESESSDDEGTDAESEGTAAEGDDSDDGGLSLAVPE